MKLLQQTMVMIFSITLLAGCGTSSSIGNGGAGTAEGPVSASEIQVYGLHYEVHDNRLRDVFGLENGDEALDLLEDSKLLLSSQILSSTAMSALMRIYAKACEEAPLDVMPQDATYAEVHFKITGVTSGEDESMLESGIVGLFAQEDNAEDYIAYAYCLAASTSVDGIVLNIGVK